MKLFGAKGETLKRSLKARVAICVPSQDQCAVGFAFDLAALCGYTAVNYPKVEISLFQARGSLLPGLRATLAQSALDAGAGHVLWIDGDMRFPKDGLVRLLEHKQPIVGASYSTRREPYFQVAAHYPPMVPIQIAPKATGLVAVDYTGFGFLLHDLDVYHKMEKPYFNFGYSRKDDGYIGEDIYFSLKAKQLGYKILVDVGLSQQIGHCGEFVFRNEHVIASTDATSEAPQE